MQLYAKILIGMSAIIYLLLTVLFIKYIFKSKEYNRKMEAQKATSEANKDEIMAAFKAAVIKPLVKFLFLFAVASVLLLLGAMLYSIQ